MIALQKVTVEKMQSATTEDLYNGQTKYSSDILLGSLHSNSMSECRQTQIMLKG